MVHIKINLKLLNFIWGRAREDWSIVRVDLTSTGWMQVDYINNNEWMNEWIWGGTSSTRKGREGLVLFFVGFCRFFSFLFFSSSSSVRMGSTRLVKHSLTQESLVVDGFTERNRTNVKFLSLLLVQVVHFRHWLAKQGNSSSSSSSASSSK